MCSHYHYYHDKNQLEFAYAADSIAAAVVVALIAAVTISAAQMPPAIQKIFVALQYRDY